MAKLRTYWLVETLPNGKSCGVRLDYPPRDRSGIHGEVKIEHDDHIAFLYAADAAAYERALRVAHDGSGEKPAPRP